MATEPRAAARWVIQQINADATLPGLMAGGKAYHVLKRSQDTRGLPGVAVGVQSAQPLTDLLFTNPVSYSEQTCIVRVQVSQETYSTVQMEAVESAVRRLLNGRHDEPMTDGQLYYCQYAGQLPDVPEDVGDVRVLTSTQLFEISAKVSS